MDTNTADVGDETTPQLDASAEDLPIVPTYSDSDIAKLVKDRTGYRTYDVTIADDGAYIIESLGGLS